MYKTVPINIISDFDYFFDYIIVPQKQTKIKPKAWISSISQGIAYHPSENEHISLSGEHIIKPQKIHARA